MPKPEVEPLNNASSRPARGTMTWIGLAAIIAFVVILAFVILRPVVDRSDGPEPGSFERQSGLRDRGPGVSRHP